MNDNKFIIQNNADLIRQMNFIERNKLDKSAFDNFKKFIDKVDKSKKIVFLLNSLDEIDVKMWIDYCLINNRNIYCVFRKSYSKWFFIKIQDINFEVEFFKNRYQPKLVDKKNLLKVLDYDYVFLPAVLFNKNLTFLDDNFFMNKRFIINDSKSKKIGYGYSIQCMNSNEIVSNDVLELDAIITDKYIID